MIIISAKNAFLKQKTGIEEYTYQLIKKFSNIIKHEQVIIYTNKIEVGVKFPLNFHLKIIHFSILWTQIGLSWQIFKCRIKKKLASSIQKSVSIKLFIPAHVMPIFHPKYTVVTIHGLEYEYFPRCYSWFSRNYLRWSTRYAVRHAWKIIAVSENTKRDLVKLYKCDPQKITVIYHGRQEVQNEKRKRRAFDRRSENLDGRWKNDNEKFKIKYQIPNTIYDIQNTKYFLYLGRIELKKNVVGIIKAFEIFKEDYELRIMNYEKGMNAKYQIPNTKYKLVLVGGKGYGWENVKLKVKSSKYKKDIIFTGYVSDYEKWQLLKNTEALLFPSFYEGFGLPILEAQNAGVPVITSKGSSTEEVATYNRKSQIPCLPAGRANRKSLHIKSALLVNPNQPEEIAEAMHRIISDQQLRNRLIQLGYENVKRFSWKKCAISALRVLTDSHRSIDRCSQIDKL